MFNFYVKDMWKSNEFSEVTAMMAMVVAMKLMGIKYKCIES
jgi:hypothetical protein